MVKSSSSPMSVPRDLFNILRHWGFDPFKIDSMVASLLNDFDHLYRVQDGGRHFRMVDELFDTATPDGTFRHMRRSDAAW